MTPLQQDFQKLEIENLITLCQLTPSDGGSKRYFTNNSKSVVFDKVPYIALGFTIDNIKFNSQGEFSNANMVVSDQDNVISTLVDESGNHLERSILDIIVTKKSFLDGEPGANILAYHLVQRFQVSQIQEIVYGDRVKIVLSNFNWMNREVGRLILSRCTVEYRGKYCRYAGPPIDIKNNPTNDTAKDDCPRDVNGCSVRFNNGLLPWKGFLTNTK